MIRPDIDPNVVYRAFKAAVVAKDWETALERSRTLGIWIQNGGYWPAEFDLTQYALATTRARKEAGR